MYALTDTFSKRQLYERVSSLSCALGVLYNGSHPTKGPAPLLGYVGVQDHHIFYFIFYLTFFLVAFINRQAFINSAFFKRDYNKTSTNYHYAEYSSTSLLLFPIFSTQLLFIQYIENH